MDRVLVTERAFYRGSRVPRVQRERRRVRACVQACVYITTGLQLFPWRYCLGCTRCICCYKSCSNCPLCCLGRFELVQCQTCFLPPQGLHPEPCPKGALLVQLLQRGAPVLPPLCKTKVS